MYNLKQIGLATINCADTNSGALPPCYGYYPATSTSGPNAGPYSTQAWILPFMEQQNVFNNLPTFAVASSGFKYGSLPLIKTYQCTTDSTQTVSPLGLTSYLSNALVFAGQCNVSLGPPVSASLSPNNVGAPNSFGVKLPLGGVTSGLLLGNPETNPAVRGALGATRWPQVTDQGIVLKRGRSDGKSVLVVGGGIPRATLWAVYELIERWGVRYLLHGEVLPENAGAFQFPEKDVVVEPVFPIRQWRTVNALPTRPESWGIADHRPVLDQLAKLKFNRLLIYLWPWRPFVRFQVVDIRRHSGTLFFGFRYPITNDMPGRQLFGSAEEFWNPDIPLPGRGKDLLSAGERLIHRLMEHGLGLTAPVSGMMMKHWQPTPMPGNLSDDHRGDQRALEAARRARAKAEPRGRPYIDYWVGRLEFAVGYFDTIAAVRRAARAEHERNHAEPLRQAEDALARARQALEAWARVARDQSDRGSIAAMGSYVYRPLKEKVAALQRTIDK